MAKTPSVRAKLEYKDMAEGSVVRFTFNPTEYTISATSSWKQTPGKGKEGPKSEFVGTLPQTISMDVLLSDKWKGEDLEDTVTLSYELRQMTKPTEKSIKNGNPSAPVLLFKWGPGVEMYECHLKSVSIKHTEFDERGTPLTRSPRSCWSVSRARRRSRTRRLAALPATARTWSRRATRCTRSPFSSTTTRRSGAVSPTSTASTTRCGCGRVSG